MGRRDSKDREEEQRISGSTVNWIPDDEWDEYSGLPSPKWYMEFNEEEEEE
tara:strand:+ start:290 stop:442 length:153 start_codon:yes stop_codon:yes gene_type:complete